MTIDTHAPHREGRVPARSVPRTRRLLSAQTRAAFAGLLLVQALGAAIRFAGDGPVARADLWLTLLALACTAGVGIWFLQRVVAPMERASEVVASLGAGDLSPEVDVSRAGELRLHVAALLHMRDNLFDMVGRVRTGMVNVATHAIQINSDNTALAERTAAQAASVRETAASVKQLIASVSQNVETSQRVHVLARTASERAERGSQAVRAIGQSMDALRAGSQNIHGIVGVIDAIAFQTNLLALNAAVEAARAQQHGRGFAVVAGEVRVLAQRCAEEARQIRDLLGAAVLQVDAADARVQEAGHTVDDLVGVVHDVTKLIGAVESASREQSAGIGTISEAMARIDGATQDNVTFVQGASRTAAALQERASLVFKVMEPFSLGAREHAAASDAVQLVEQGCDFLRTHGREAFLAEVNKLDAGRFIYRDLYLMVIDVSNVTFVAHGHLRNRLGTGPQVKDVDGKYFPREMVKVARDRGEGWVDYKWVHPVTGAVFKKAGYVRGALGLAVYAGVYTS